MPASRTNVGLMTETPDPAVAQLLAEGESETAQAELRRVVDGDQCRRYLALDGGHQDDVAGPAGQHPWQHEIREDYSRAQIDIQRAIDFFDGEGD